MSKLQLSAVVPEVEHNAAVLTLVMLEVAGWIAAAVPHLPTANAMDYSNRTPSPLVGSRQPRSAVEADFAVRPVSRSSRKACTAVFLALVAVCSRTFG